MFMCNSLIGLGIERDNATFARGGGEVTWLSGALQNHGHGVHRRFLADFCPSHLHFALAKVHALLASGGVGDVPHLFVVSTRP